MPTPPTPHPPPGRLTPLAAADVHDDLLAARHDLDRLQRLLAGAVTALQFEDLASQLIVHTAQRLRSCADRLACEVMHDDGDGPAIVVERPPRPDPVTRDEMDAGSVELF